ncbi:NAD(P)-dependent oxidoreductase [Allokutzneria albata]|uniref:D-3-phosphoglycerate dehydrogenase n=1 Tax=Allokutzneria albata TaxID=211114 RepID=A0A1G9X464_ALLAB|nr:2-hydroxyacid dehydrogenase [Allokutzneria albata]SDM91492.1 D-3-phosphoglycerate dehydrogenase [Allokutzneria albata]
MKVLVVLPPHVGGVKLGGMFAAALGPDFEVTPVEDAGADPVALREAEVIVTALAPIGAEHIAAAENLRLVQCASHGFDYVDTAAAAARGVRVCNIGSTSAEAQDVAEQTMTLMLALAKQLIPGHEALREGEWALPRLQFSITELFGKTLGIVGFGAIGRQLAKRARAFDMRIIVATRTPVPVEVMNDYGVAARMELDELLAEADYVSLQLPLTEATRNLVDERRLKLMKPTAILVNTARGALVDQDTLARALTDGRLGGAGLDVFDPEPPPADLPLLRAPNVALSPHAGGVTRESMLRIAQAALENVRRFAAGAELSDVVET